MHPKIAERIEKLDVDRNILIQKVLSLPEDKQHAKTTPDCMSPADVLKHLAIIEGGNVKFLEKNPTATLKGQKIRHGFFFKRTLNGMRDTSKEYPTMPMFVPKGKTNVGEAIKELERIREITVKNLGDAETPESPFIKMMFLFGTLSASDYLELGEVHIKYHLRRFPQV